MTETARSVGSTVASVSVSDHDPFEGQYFIAVMRDEGMWFMGPFDSHEDATEWGQDTLRTNPDDDPRWQTLVLPHVNYKLLDNKMVSLGVYDPNVFDMDLNKLESPPPVSDTDKDDESPRDPTSKKAYHLGVMRGLGIATEMTNFCDAHYISTSTLLAMLGERFEAEDNTLNED